MATFKLVFSGKLVAGKTEDQVRTAAVAALKLSQSAVDKLFNAAGKAIVIKTVNSAEEAERFVTRFQSVGMVLTVQPVELSVAPLDLAPQAVTAPASGDDADESADKPGIARVLLVNLRTLFSIPVALLTLGLVLGALYLPYPQGFLKNGFVVGCVLFALGFKMLRARA